MDYFSVEYEEEVKKRGPASYHLVLRYLQKFEFEDREDIDVEEFYPPDPHQDNCIYPIKKVPYPHERYKRFLKQIRESNGYDIDCYPPPVLPSPFDRMDLATIPEHVRNIITRFAENAIEEINATEKRKRYELVRVEKAVKSYTHACFLLTSCVKDVDDASSHKTLRAMVSYTRGIRDKCRLDEWMFIPTPPAPDPDEAEKYRIGYSMKHICMKDYHPDVDDDNDEDDENIKEDA